MTVPNDRTYPKAATNKTWQSKKSVMDKTSAKTKQTGLKPLLEAAEAAWATINWSWMNGSSLAEVGSVADALKEQKFAMQAKAEVEDVRKKLKAARDKATTVST